MVVAVMVAVGIVAAVVVVIGGGGGGGGGGDGGGGGGGGGGDSDRSGDQFAGATGKLHRKSLTPIAWDIPSE